MRITWDLNKIDDAITSISRELANPKIKKGRKKFLEDCLLYYRSCLKDANTTCELYESEDESFSNENIDIVNYLKENFKDVIGKYNKYALHYTDKIIDLIVNEDFDSGITNFKVDELLYKANDLEMQNLIIDFFKSWFDVSIGTDMVYLLNPENRFVHYREPSEELSFSTYGVTSYDYYLEHPRVILNRFNIIDDPITLAHESSHMYMLYKNPSFISKKFAPYFLEADTIAIELLFIDYLKINGVIPDKLGNALHKNMLTSTSDFAFNILVKSLACTSIENGKINYDKLNTLLNSWKIDMDIQEEDLFEYASCDTVIDMCEVLSYPLALDLYNMYYDDFEGFMKHYSRTPFLNSSRFHNYLDGRGATFHRNNLKVLKQKIKTF